MSSSYMNKNQIGKLDKESLLRLFEYGTGISRNESLCDRFSHGLGGAMDTKDELAKMKAGCGLISWNSFQRMSTLTCHMAHVFDHAPWHHASLSLMWRRI